MYGYVQKREVSYLKRVAIIALLTLVVSTIFGGMCILVSEYELSNLDECPNIHQTTMSIKQDITGG